MKIAQKYSHLNGEEYLLVHHNKLYKEIVDVIESIDAEQLRTKISKEQKKIGSALLSPIGLNEAFNEAFDKKGWNVTNENLHIFMIAGQEDPVIQGKDKFEQLKQFLMGVGYKNVFSKLYPTLKHEILNEKENQMIYEDIYEFIKSAKD